MLCFIVIRDACDPVLEGAAVPQFTPCFEIVSDRTSFGRLGKGFAAGGAPLPEFGPAAITQGLAAAK